MLPLEIVLTYARSAIAKLTEQLIQMKKQLRQMNAQLQVEPTQRHLLEREMRSPVEEE